MFYTNPDSGISHAVLNFAITAQTWAVKQPTDTHNFSGMLSALFANAASGIGFKGELLLNHYGQSDEWDAVSVVFFHADIGQAQFQAETMFPYIQVLFHTYTKPRFMLTGSHDGYPLPSKLFL